MRRKWQVYACDGPRRTSEKREMRPIAHMSSDQRRTGPGKLLESMGCDNRFMDHLTPPAPGSLREQREPVYLLRNRSQFVKGGALVIFGFIVFAISLIDSNRVSLIPPILIIVGICGFAVGFFFLPYLSVDASGILTVNWLRTITIPWAAYRGVSSRFGLEILSDDGARNSVACFPGSGGISVGRDRLGGPRPSGVDPDAVGQSMRHAPQHPAGRAISPTEMIPIYPSGTHTTWTSISSAYSFIERFAPGFSPITETSVRAVNLHTNGTVMIGIATLSFAGGVWLSWS